MNILGFKVWTIKILFWPKFNKSRMLSYREYIKLRKIIKNGKDKKKPLPRMKKGIKNYPQIASNTPAATAEPMTPATLGPIACISK